MSSRPNTPYRPRLCSHDVSKTDIARQAPDTRHQALYTPDTCFVCVDNALDDDTPANMALQLHINVSLNRPPDHTTHARVEAWCRLWTWWWCNDVTDARCSAELSDGLCDNTDIYSWRTVYRQSGSDGKGKKRQFCRSKVWRSKEQQTLMVATLSFTHVAETGMPTENSCMYSCFTKSWVQIAKSVAAFYRRFSGG